MFHLEKISLKNYREFKEIEIDFHPQLTVLVAKNGGGKTAILDAIAVAFGPFIGGFSEGKSVHFAVSDIRQSLRLGGKEIEFHTPVQLSAEGVIAGNRLWWRRMLSGKKSRTTISEAKNLIATAKRIEDNTGLETEIFPLISYYGTGRLWKTIKLTEGKAKASKQKSRSAGYIDCLDPASSYNAAADWMYYAHMMNIESMMHNDFDGDKNAPYKAEMQAIVRATNTCLQSSGWKDIRYSIQYEELTLWNAEYGRLPVSYLSDGIRNIVGLSLDIAYRAAKLNSWMAERCVEDTPGIVMIDEIDMHLHPAWQQEVLPQLIKAFPKMQFIVTTHSPQVLTTVAPECIRIIVAANEEGVNEISIPEFSLGAESNLVLERVQKVSARPSQIEIVKKLNKYLEFIYNNRWDCKEALELREELDTWGKSYDPLLSRIDVDIRVREYRRKSDGQSL